MPKFEYTKVNQLPKNRELVNSAFINAEIKLKLKTDYDCHTIAFWIKYNCVYASLNNSHEYICVKLL